MKIRDFSPDPRRPYLNLQPIVDALVDLGNRTIDGGFVLNPDGWRCRLIRPIDVNFVRSAFDLPSTIVVSEEYDSILDKRSWSSIEGPGANPA